MEQSRYSPAQKLRQIAARDFFNELIDYVDEQWLLFARGGVSFMVGQTIETARLMLRPMRAEDAAQLLQVFSDPTVMASFGQPPFDPPAMDEWVRRNLDHQERHGYGLFVVVLRESGLLIGDCGLECMHVDGTAETELGYDLRSEYWNRGLGTEAATAVRDYAFGPLALPRLISLIRSTNLASRRVAEKIGMRLERTLIRGGHDYWMYSLDHDPYQVVRHEGSGGQRHG